MEKVPGVRLIDLVTSLSDAMDYIDTAVVNHHRQVAFAALCIAEQIGLPPEQQKDLLLASALHDIGAFSLRERLDSLRFEIEKPHEHSEKGYRLLRLFEPLSSAADAVRHHHVPWEQGEGTHYGGRKVSVLSHLLHIADRIVVLVDRESEVLGQVPGICRKIRKKKGGIFKPELVDAFLDMASKEYFWLDLVSPTLPTALANRFGPASISLDSDDMVGFSRLFSKIIDFKSPFTATHSSGVASTSQALARLSGFSERDSLFIRIAGYLHDLGKLAVPVEILDKPAGLDKEEFNVVRHHTFYTYRILEVLPSFHQINQWAAFHHERLDGSGYPFHLKADELPVGSQIVSVADIFTALSEDRPYRTGMRGIAALHELDLMAGRSAINGDIVSILRENYDQINSARKKAQAAAVREYRTLQ